MNCPKCGTALAQNAKSCTACGTTFSNTSTQANPRPATAASNVTTPEVQPAAPTNTKKIYVAELTVGIIITVIGLIRVASSVLHSSTSFGADFYTYAYDMLVSIEASLGWLIAAIGAVLIFKSVRH